MTSEGQYAGTQPAEATSGGPGSDGFPPDADGRRIAARASASQPADGFPSSYAPPPQATPNGGSPFVVPAVRTFGSGSESAAASPARPTGTPYGSARVPQPEEEQPRPASPYGSVSPGTASSYGSAAPQAASSPFAPPPAENGAAPASPFGSPAPDAGASPFGAPAPAAPLGTQPPAAGSSFVPASGNAPEPPRSAWAPQQAATGDGQFPLPQRTPAGVDPGTIGEFDGFAAAAARGSGEQPPAGDADRPPGVSAFGAQRVRVPGATLADLPDAPPSVRAGRSGDSGGFPATRPADDSTFPPARAGDGTLPPARADDGSGFPLRSGNASFPTRRGESGGFPLRGAAIGDGPAADPLTPSASQPPVSATELPIRSQQGPFGPPSVQTDGLVPSAGSFSAFGGQPAEEAPHPYGRPAETDHPYARPADGSADPFGRPAAETPAGTYGRPVDAQADPYGRPAADAAADPFGRPTDAQADPYGRAAEPFGRRPGAEQAPAAPESDRGGLPDPFGRTGAAADSPFGSAPETAGSPFGAARPESTFGTAKPEAPAYGSARPASPAGGSQYGTAKPASPAPAFGTTPSDAPASPAFGAAKPFGPGNDGDQLPFGGSAPAGPFGSARPASPAPDQGSPFGSARPASPFGGDEQAAFRPSSPAGQFGGQERPPYQPASPAGQFGDDRAPYQPSSPAGQFGDERAPYQPSSPAGQFGGDEQASFRPSAPAGPFGGDEQAPFKPVSAAGQFGAGESADGDRPGFGSAAHGDQADAGDEHAMYRRPDGAAPESGGYPQRVPGAAFGENHPVPAPRDSAEQSAAGGPATASGSARPVTASASVPTASRRTPIDPTDLPPAAAAPQARVYGRPAAPAEPANDEPADEPGFPAAPEASSFDDIRPASGGTYGSPSGYHPPPAFGTPADGASSPFGAPAESGAPSPFGPPDGFDAPNGYGSPAGNNAPATFGTPAGGAPAPFSPPTGGAASPFGPPDGFDGPNGFGAQAGGDASNTYGPPAGGGAPSTFGAPVDGGFSAPAYPPPPGEHSGPGSEPGMPGVAPQSPARASARASASARVAPPVPSGPPAPGQPGPDQPRNLPPYAEFTTPAPASGGGYPPFGGQGPNGPGPNGPVPFGPPPGQGNEQYSEMTTDIAGRGGEPPYSGFPMASSPETSGAASRATVTPPSPDDTTSWPGPSEQGRFDQFKAEEKPAKPETPHVRMLPILVAVVVGAILLLGVVFGIVYLVAGGKEDKSFSVSAGECVKRDGNAAVKADCSDTTSFEVVSIADDKSKCADPQQPYVVNPTSDGKNQVLCLKPHS
ncbi:hypothetical protein [Paractinoplanes durhamensis]|nr:hypothetical protein [Actinoplanes durhamensis]